MRRARSNQVIRSDAVLQWSGGEVEPVVGGCSRIRGRKWMDVPDLRREGDYSTQHRVVRRELGESKSPQWCGGEVERRRRSSRGGRAQCGWVAAPDLLPEVEYEHGAEGDETVAAGQRARGEVAVEWSSGIGRAHV